MVLCAPGARTIRMCSLDGRSGTNRGGLTPGWLLIRRNVRSEAPNQADPLERENEQAWIFSIPNAHWLARLPPSGTWLPRMRLGVYPGDEPSPFGHMAPTSPFRQAIGAPASLLLDCPSTLLLKKYIDSCVVRGP